MKTVDLRHLFLIRESHDDFLVHANGEVTIGFKMSQLPYGVSSVTTQRKIFDFINRIFRGWEDGTWLQSQDFFWQKIVKPDNQKHYSDISRENFKYYSMRPTMGHRSYVYITFVPNSFKNIALNDSQFSRLASYVLNPPKSNIEKEVRPQIETLKEEFKKGTFGYRGKIMDRSEWEKVCYAYYTGNYNLDEIEVPDTLDLGSFTVLDEGYVQRENKIFSTVYMGSEPRESVIMSDNYKVQSYKDGMEDYKPNEDLKNYAAFPLNGGIPFDHVTNVIVQKGNSESIINELNNQNKLNSAGIQSNGKYDADKLNAESKETSKAHLEQLKQNIQNSPFPACSYGVSVTIPSHDKKELSEKSDIVKSAFTAYSARGEYHRAHNMPTFFSTAPGHGHNMHDLFIGQTVNALPFININTYNKGDSSGILFTDASTGEPVNFEPWYNPLLAGVRNGQIIGPTRGGKSVLVATITDYFVNNGFHQIIIDKGNSYKWLSLVYGAKYVSLNPEAKEGIELFDYNPASMSVLHKSIVVSILSKIYPKRDENTIAAVTNMIELYNQECRNRGVSTAFEGFYTFYTKEYIKGKSVYGKHMDFELYASELERFVYGDNKWLFNNENSISINHEPFVIFELKALESSPLFGLATEALLSLVNAKMEFWNRAIPIDIKIDEALQSFEDPNSADLIKQFYTQVGKFNAAVSIMVQGVNLVKELPIWDAVNDNTQLRIYTYNKHLDGWVENQRDALGWSSHRYQLAKNLRSTDKFRELLLIAGEEEKVLRLELSPIADYTFSTTPEVWKEVEKLHKENPERSLKEVIFQHYYQNKKRK